MIKSVRARCTTTKLVNDSKSRCAGAPAEEVMQNWKKALIVGSLGVGAAVAITGRRPIGLAMMAGGLALLASEYPERFEDVWENAPEYLNKGMQIFAALNRMSERLAEEAGRRGMAVYHDFEQEYGR
jgi:hypothetical protein